MNHLNKCPEKRWISYYQCFSLPLPPCGQLILCIATSHSNERLTWCMSSLSVVWRATALWNSSLGGKRLLPLFSSLAPDFLWFMGSGCVGFWWRGGTGKEDKECGNKLLWRGRRLWIVGALFWDDSGLQRSKARWRMSWNGKVEAACQAEMQRGFTEGWFTASEDFRATRERLEIDLGKGEGKRTKGAKCKASRSYASLRLIQIPVITL